jgi:uncharacterized protein (DUF4415 family)
MSNINYSDAPDDIEQALAGAVPANDLLPSPAELVRKTEKEKITIAVDKRSLEKYRRYAKQHNAKYQTMINGVLDFYADRYLSRH